MKLNSLLPSRRRAAQALLAAVGVAAAFAVPMGSTAHGADVPTSQPAAGDGRPFEAVDADLRAAIERVHKVLGDPKVLADPDQRKAVAAKAVPALTGVCDLFDELVRVRPQDRADIAGPRTEYLTFLALLDDGGAKRLAALAGSTFPAESVAAASGELTVKWMQTDRDPAAQTKVFDDFVRLAKDHPDSDAARDQAAFAADVGAASPDLGARLKSLFPLVIAGKTVDGKDFTTADWKGKVVLVDFWATWCGPCKAELPNVKEMYEKYHERGLEIIGVSNDQSADELTKFVADDKKMPWPQLFDAAAATRGDWNPITQGFGINGIPTMYLIDRHGVLRSVEARENMRDLIPKLLAEK